MNINKNSDRFPYEILGQLKAGSQPVVGRIDRISSPTQIEITLLVDALARRAETSLTVRTTPETRPYNSLTTMIRGNERMPPLVPGDVVGFNDAFLVDGIAYAGDVTARTHDRMRGRVQVVTAMAKPSKSVVNKKGALQSLVIADGASGSGTYTYEGVREAFERAKARSWIGGAPGLIVRNEDGRVLKEFYAEGRETIDMLIEDLEHAEALASKGDVLELIPTWRLPMGREQVMREVGDPKQERPSQIGNFGRRFVSKDTAGFIGFLPCLVVLCEEDQWEFGANTGRKAMVAAGVQPLDPLPPIPRDKLPSAVRTFKRVPATVNRLYDEATMEAMAKDRLARQPDDAPAATPKPAAARPIGGGRPAQGGAISLNGNPFTANRGFRR